MVKKPIRNLRSNKSIPPRIFDVIVDNGKVDIEIKTEKNKYEKVPWDDIVSQVEAAKDVALATQKLPQSAP